MKDDYAAVFNKSLKFLSYRPRSEHETAQYLLKKGVDQPLLKKIIDRLKELKFLNDQDFCRWWIEQRRGINPRGLRLVKVELKKKGISDELIEAELRKNCQGVTDLELAERIVQKRLPKLKGLAGFTIKKKLYYLLLQRGFDFEIVRQAVYKALKKE